MILYSGKRPSAPFSCLPARTGPGRARYRVKGLVPCRFSGLRPEPSESNPPLITVIFQGPSGSFFFDAVFIRHLTLPNKCRCLRNCTYFTIFSISCILSHLFGFSTFALSKTYLIFKENSTKIYFLFSIS